MGRSRSVGEIQERSGAKISFTQVCRNNLHCKLKDIAQNELLECWCKGGGALHACNACPACNVIASNQCKNGDEFAYCLLLVSVKNRAQFNPKQRSVAMEAMTKTFEDNDVLTGLCVLMLIGLEEENLTNCCFDFQHGKVSGIKIFLPADDDYDMTILSQSSACGGGERAEVCASHAEVVHSTAQPGTKALQSRMKKDDASSKLFENLTQSLSALFKNS